MTTSFPIGNIGGLYISTDFVQALESADLKALITNVGSGVGAAPAGGAAPAAGGAAPAAAAEVILNGPFALCFNTCPPLSGPQEGGEEGRVRGGGR